MTSEPFAKLAAALQPLGGSVFHPLDALELRPLRYEDLLFGYFVGLLDPKSVVNVETERSRRGYAEDLRQSHLVTLLTDDSDAIDEYLQRSSQDAIFADRAARTLWLRIVLQLMLVNWDSGTGDPILESVELFAAWENEGHEVWQVVRPRGLDSLVFGAAARTRFTNRIREYLHGGYRAE